MFGPLRPVVLAVLALVCLSSGAALASDGTYAVATGITGLDGLFYTTSGKTLKAATFVLGGGGVYATGGDRAGAESALTTPFTATMGFSDRLETALSFPVISHLELDGGGSVSGVGDIDLRAKYSLQGETADMPALAVYGRVKLGVADEEEGLGTGKTDAGIGFAADKAFGGVQAMLNAEILVQDKEVGGNQLNWALGLRIPYSEATRFSVELLDQYFVTGSAIGGQFLAGGVSFDLPPAMVLAFNVGAGLNDQTSNAILLAVKFDFTL